ncbi:hypothetical protein LJC56_10090 [Christensenellaceae bacterium OttesenSCG-928-K19]|nr:hypothetical protein [Christensenellaceae bacterium OttesenSCG-928-K19]
MARKPKEKSFDIRSEAFAPLLDQMQGQLVECIKAIQTGVVDNGTITATIDLELDRVMEQVPVDKGGSFETELLPHIFPQIGYASTFHLSKKDKVAGQLSMDDLELVSVNDGWVLRELQKPQMHIDDLEEQAEDENDAD